MKSRAVKFLARAVALVACATVALAASPSPSWAKSSENASNWAARTAVTPDGSHALGNPEAPVKLIEYLSYTCPHCAHFHREADAALRLTLIPKGQIQITVVNLLRNPVDLTVAMLTSCGDPKRFWMRHNAFLGTQDTWLPKAQEMSREQQMRWYQGEMTNRLRAVASDFGFYAKVQQWGVDRAQADRCLADKAMLDKLRQQQASAQDLGITGTPSFVLNGEVQDFHDWATLSKAISKELATRKAGNI
jgi:protein-disulfide isomerase